MSGFLQKWANVSPTPRKTASVKEAECVELTQPDLGPAELAAATALLNRTGCRILPGDTIGIWSDLDSPAIRQALRFLGMGELPVRYLDGNGIPIRYTLRRVAGEPVPNYALAQMEQAVEPWAIRDRLLGKIWHFAGSREIAQKFNSSRRER